MIKITFILLTLMSMFFVVGNAAGREFYNSESGTYDLDSDGKLDGSVEFYNCPDKNDTCYQSGANFKKAEFDINFDGVMDISIQFKAPYGCLKRDSDFDGDFDTVYSLIHFGDSRASYAPYGAGRWDTWFILEKDRNICHEMETITDEELYQYLTFPSSSAEVLEQISETKSLEDFLDSIYFSKTKRCQP